MEARASTPATMPAVPKISIGTQVTNFAGFDITVEGMASGGMGLVVWGKNAARGGQMKAVKLPRPDRLAQASPERQRQILADFEHEALVWCHLWPHSCIITAESLLRLHSLGDLPALFLEYAPHGSLRDHLQRVHAPGSTSTLSAEGVFAWGQMVAAALAAIHQPEPGLERPEPLVHCDLKPENVLVDARTWAKLTDLGLTRALAALADLAPATPATPAAPSALAESGNLPPGLTAEQRAQAAQLRRLLEQAGVTLPQPDAPGMPAMPGKAGVPNLYATRTVRVAAPGAPTSQALSLLPASATQAVAAMGTRGPVAGTPPYMAPEQWQGLDAVEPASDIYAFGVLLFELFAGVGGAAAFPHVPDLGVALTQGQFVAWCLAHHSGPARHLFDPEVEAFEGGPLYTLAHQDRPRAERVLAGLDALIQDCLAVEPAARPSAATCQTRLAALAQEAGEEPVTIPAYPRTPELEEIFWGNLGITYGELGQPAEQLRLLRKAVALAPEDPQTLSTLGSALNEQARAERRAGHEAQAVALFEESATTFQTAEARFAADPTWQERYPHLADSTPYNLGGSLSDLGRYAEAVAATEQALAAKPDNAPTYFGLGLIYLRWSEVPEATPTERVERLEQAQASTTRLLELAPHYVDGRALLAQIEAAFTEARRKP